MGRVFLSNSGATPIRRSTDHGATWADAFAGITGSQVGEIELHPTQADVAITGSSAGIFRTTDAGASWTLEFSGDLSNAGIVWSQADASRIYANRSNAQNALYRSDDGGATFVHVDRGSCGFFCPTRAIGGDPTNPDRVFLQQDVEAVYWRILETTDAGVTWPTVYTLSADRLFDGQQAHSFLVDPSDPDRVFLASSNYVSLISNGWSPDGLRRSTDGGTTWATAMNGLASRRIHAVGETTAGLVFARDDRPQGPFSQGEPLDDQWVQSPIGEGATYRYSLKTFDVNWSSGIAFESGLFNDFDIYYEWRFFYEPDFEDLHGWTESAGFNPEPLHLAVSNPGNGSFRYAWQGTTVWRAGGLGPFGNWAEVGTSPHAAGAVVHPNQPHHVFLVALNTAGVHASTDGGVTWTPRSNGLPADDGVELLMRRNEPNTMVAVFEHDGVYETTDAGESWTDRALDWGGADAVGACWGLGEESVIVATEAGVFVEGIGIVDAGITTRRLTSVAYSEAHGAILLGTEHSAVWTYPLGDVVAAPVVAAASPSLVVWPNPFATRTTLRLARVADEPARFDVFDVQGRLVRRLQATGPSSDVVWDARDGSGDRVAPGVYLVRATAGATSATQRVVHVR